MTITWKEVCKYLFGVTTAGELMLIVQPLWAFVAVCFLAILIDCWSAYKLSIRVKRKYGKSKGKFQSFHAKKVFNTMAFILKMLLLVFMLDKIILSPEHFYFSKFLTGAFCGLQIWSILENASSESENKWMKPLQKILVNKAERHFDIELDEVVNEYRKDNKKNKK